MDLFLEVLRLHGLAIAALIVVTSALSIVARTLFQELKDRIKRAENLTDELVRAFDKSTAVAEAALDELRRKP